MDYTSLLSGASGSLGLGGGVGGGGGGGGGGYGSSASTATAGDITSGPINPSIGNITGGHFDMSPNVSVAFPGAEFNGTTPPINSPIAALGGTNVLYMIAAAIGIVLLAMIFRS